MQEEGLSPEESLEHPWPGASATSHHFLLHSRICQLLSSSALWVVTLHWSPSCEKTSSGQMQETFLGLHCLFLHSLTCCWQSVTFQLSGLDNFPWTPMHMPFAHEENLALALLSRSIYPGMKYGFPCLVPCSNHTGHLSLIIVICQPSTIITSPRHHLCTYVPIKSHIYI